MEAQDSTWQPGYLTHRSFTPIADAPVSAAAAKALEWVAVRSSGQQLEAPSREAFEGDMVDLLALALYVPYGTAAARSTAPPVNGHGGGAQYGGRPWHARVTALMPADGLTAAAVRDAASLLTAVADTADWMEQQQQQQQQAQGQGQGQGQGRGTLPSRGSGGIGAGSKAAAGPGAAVQASGGSGLGKRVGGPLPSLESLPQEQATMDVGGGLVLHGGLTSGRHSAPVGGVASSGDVSGIGLVGAGAGSGGLGAAPGGVLGHAEWGALAGRAATAFQRIANGPLLMQQQQGGQQQQLQAGVAVAVGQGQGAGTGGVGAAAAAAAAERRRQLAWVLLLLAAKSQAHR